MNISVTNELLVFFSSFIGGVLMGIIFDFFRIIRKIKKHGDILTAIEDILFWIISSVLVFFIVLYFNSGEIRWYIFVALVIGSVLYYLTISSFLRKIVLWIISFLIKIIKFLIKSITFPFIFILKPLKKPILILFKKIKLTSRRICFKIKSDCSVFKKNLKRI